VNQHVELVVGVGTAITRCPLHGSGRAAFPHPALASGGDAQTVPGIWMADADGRKPAAYESGHPLPSESVLLTTAPQTVTPEPSHCPPEGSQRARIHGYAIIVVVTTNHCSQIAALLGDGAVPAPAQFCFYFAQLRLHALTHRTPPDDESPFPAHVIEKNDCFEASAVERERISLSLYSLTVSVETGLRRARLDCS
jgi:hypothetical protein